jgi:PmbA protein
MEQKMRDTAQFVLDKYLKKGGSSGEVFLVESKKLHLEVENGQLDLINNSVDILMAVRALIDHSPGFAFCTDFSSSSLEMLIDQVLTCARNTDGDPHTIFPSPQESKISPPFDKNLASIDIKEKIKLCQEMESAAYKTDPRIKAARHISYSDEISEVYLINSSGVEVSFGNTVCTTFTMVIAQDGAESQMAWEMDIQRFYDRLGSVEVAQKAARMALSLLGARSIPSQKAAVILSPPAAVSILGAFAPAFFADSVQKGRSLMAGRLGEMVASAETHLVDDGALPEGLVSAPYDGEGVPMQRTPVIQGGRLNAYLYDAYTAHKDGVSSTGNGMRPGPKSQPQVGPTNMFMESGACTEKELLSSVKEGLYVTEVMGAHTINPISGDFSLGATGYWIENGEKAYPVRGVTISGNMLDLLKGISGRANNLRFYGHFGSPSILISSMIIAGDPNTL